MDDPGAEDALRPGRIAAHEIEVGCLAIGDLKLACVLLQLGLIDRVESELSTPAIDVGEITASFPSQRHHGYLGEMLSVPDEKHRQAWDTLTRFGRPLFPIVGFGE